MLGKLARDKVTGLQGIITAKVLYLSGCTQYCIQPPVDKEGKNVEGHYYDEGRIEMVVQEKKLEVDKTANGDVANPGGPADNEPPIR